VNGDAEAYAATRLDILADRLLPLDILKGMIHQDPDHIIQTLQPLIPDYQSDMPLAAFRHLINQHMYLDFQTLLRPYHGNKRRFLKHGVRWFELVNLKVMIRGKFTGVAESELLDQLIDLGEYADLPVRQLLETDDPFEMLRRLEQTAYGDIVRQARRVFEEQGHDLFSLDAAIDRSFFIELVSRARFVGLPDQDGLRQLLGVLMDRFNLMWLLRYRFSYGLSPGKSYYLLTASGRLLKSPELMQLAKLGSLGEFIEALPPQLKQLLSGVHDSYQVEQLMELHSLSAARRSLGHQERPITRLFAYLLLREAQTRYLQAILKGKELGFAENLIERAVGAGS
jgi:V/A-type H+-transporting ATPase subunit C